MAQHRDASSSGRQVVLLSQQERGGLAARSLANANHFEAEDVLFDSGAADRRFLMAEDDDATVRVRRAAGRVIRTARPGASLPAFGPSSVTLDGEYRVAVALVRTIWDVTLLETVRSLRRRVDKVVLWVFEMWPSGVVSELRHAPFHLVDLVLVGTTEEAAEQLDDLIDPPVRFMPAGIDVSTFVPRNRHVRTIDVLNIGRRDPSFHELLLDRARRAGLYYVFDTTVGARLDDHRSHRWLLAQHYQRTKVAMTSAAKFDLAATGERALRAMPNRVFEAMAAGAVLVGSPPPSISRQESQLGVPVVRELPDDPGAAVDEIVRLLGLDLSDERRRNMELAIRHHDWSDRWLRLFDAINEPPPPEIERRHEELRSMLTAAQS